VKVKGESLEIRFLDVPSQLPIGGTNVTYSILLANVIYMLKCILSPDVPGNEGNFCPITVTAPKGSVFNCTRPAAVNNRTRTTWNIHPALSRAMAAIIPERVRAHTGFPLALKTYGYTSEGEAFNDHMFNGGGLGATCRGDGETTVHFPTAAANVSVEIFEMRTGFFIEEKEFIPDSGGPGKFRGAPGQRMTIRRRPGETGGQYTIGGWSTGLLTDTPGLHGADAGGRMRFYSVAVPGGPVQDHFKGLFIDLDERTRITVEMAGGSGFGDPKSRDPEAIRKDIIEELSTPEGACEQYGWKMDR
jgi:N-methylhydantoinase B/oxoprolinase/acetone carboxylase alpha subunit